MPKYKVYDYGNDRCCNNEHISCGRQNKCKKYYMNDCKNYCKDYCKDYCKYYCSKYSKDNGCINLEQKFKEKSRETNKYINYLNKKIERRSDNSSLKNKLHILEQKIQNLQHLQHLQQKECNSVVHNNNSESGISGIVCVSTTIFDEKIMSNYTSTGGVTTVWGKILVEDILIKQTCGSLTIDELDLEGKEISGTVSIYNSENKHIYQGIIYLHDNQIKLKFSNRPIIPLYLPITGVITLTISIFPTA